MLLVYVSALVASGWRAPQADRADVGFALCMALGLPLISSSLQAFLYTVLQWNLGVRVSQQPKKRTLNIHDHDPCSTTSDPKEDLKCCTVSVVKGSSVDPYGAQAKNLTCLLVKLVTKWS